MYGWHYRKVQLNERMNLPITIAKAVASPPYKGTLLVLLILEGYKIITIVVVRLSFSSSNNLHLEP